MAKYKFPDKSAEELAKEMDESLNNDKEITSQEVKEDDAEYGYFEED